MYRMVVAIVVGLCCLISVGISVFASHDKQRVKQLQELMAQLDDLWKGEKFIFENRDALLPAERISRDQFQYFADVAAIKYKTIESIPQLALELMISNDEWWLDCINAVAQAKESYKSIAQPRYRLIPPMRKLRRAILDMQRAVDHTFRSCYKAALRDLNQVIDHLVDELIDRQPFARFTTTSISALCDTTIDRRLFIIKASSNAEGILISIETPNSTDR